MDDENLLTALAEAGTAYSAAEVFAAHFDDNAHFGKAGAHALADAVAKGFFAHGARGGVSTDSTGLEVGVVGGDDGGPLVVVAGIEDVSDSVPDPLGGFGGAELVEDEDFGFKDGAKDFELGGGHLGVVGVLDFLEQLAVVAEEALHSFFDDQRLEDAHCQMSLADADGAGEQQAVTFRCGRVAVDEAACHEMRRRQRTVGAGEAGFVAFQGAVLVAAGDAGSEERAGNALFLAAGAGFGGAGAVGTHDDEHSHSIALWAYLGRRHLGVSV
jgi:hypothetical protein